MQWTQWFQLPTPTQLIAVAMTLVLCGLIGFEREYLKRDAGIRTHILVGLGSCLFTLVSIYGVPATLGGGVTWDSSRIAAGVVSGIGFIGAGVIFFNHDTVRGLTTASAIWVAAAIGVACGVGMFTVAVLGVLLYFVAVLAIAPIVKWLLRNRQRTVLRILYEDGHGSLRQALLHATQQGFESQVTSTHEIKRDDWRGASVEVQLTGKGDVASLVESISESNGVKAVDVLGNDD